MSHVYLLLYYLLGINLLAFTLYGVDKGKAKRGAWRTPEWVLIFVALIGGSLGALFAMSVFHHKTLHKKFSIGVPLVFLLQVLCWIVLAFASSW